VKERRARRARRTLRAGRDARPILATFENPAPGRDYEIVHTAPEFTSVCPMTGQPDFGTITVSYVPDRRCVELKSLKLYLFGFRDRGIFYEAAVNTILEDLVASLAPRRLEVRGEFRVRGGIASTVTARFPDLPAPLSPGTGGPES
jgi:7-cyano-7-deazaguanine reductase